MITLCNVCSVHQGMFSTLGDTMMYVGEQRDKSLSIYIENPDVLKIPQCTHDIIPMYWTPAPDIPMISPWCTHGIPPMYWTSFDVLMISPDVLMVSPRCTHGISPMYWTHIIQGVDKTSVWTKLSVSSKHFYPPGQPRSIWPKFLPRGQIFDQDRAFDLKIN